MKAREESPDVFPLVAFLWACAHSLSALSATVWFAELRELRFSPALLADCALFAAAVLTVLRPGEPRFFASMVGLQIVQTLVYLPEVPNHRILMFCMNLGLATTLLGGAFRRQDSPSIRAGLTEVFTRLSPPVLAAVYFFATLAKLNRDFLDPEISCGTAFLGHITGIFPSLAFAEGSAAIWITIVVEGLLPPALLFRKTRRWAVLVGVLFHYGVALDLVKRFYNFSAVMSALLVASLGEGLLRQSLRALEDRFSRQVRVRPFLSMLRTFFAVWLTGLFAFGLLVEPTVAWRVFIGAWSLWTLLGLFAIALAVTAVVTPTEIAADATRVPRAAVVVPVLLILANGCGPYLGFKTRTSFNMYSNLRLEADAGNHLMFPRSLDLFGFLADDVELLETNDELLQRNYVEKGYRITRFELERHLAGRDFSELHLVVRRNGRVETVTSAPQPSFVRRIQWKLLVFRPLGPEVVRECIW
jgi:hypothetical protein